MVVSFGANAPRPVLHQVNAAHGDLTRTPAFPNHAFLCTAEQSAAEPPSYADDQGGLTKDEAARLAEEKQERIKVRDAEERRRREAEEKRKAEEAARLADEKRLLRLQRQLAGCKLLIIDELGYVPLSQTGAELLFEVFSQRYERGSTLVTSNLPFDEWTSVFASERLTGALLDRLTHHVHILEMNGESYRLQQSKQRQRIATAETADHQADTGSLTAHFSRSRPSRIT